MDLGIKFEAQTWIIVCALPLPLLHELICRLPLPLLLLLSSSSGVESQIYIVLHLYL